MNDFAQAVQTLRPQLLRSAHARLRNQAWAEDAVSDTVLAAVTIPGFAGNGYCGGSPQPPPPGVSITN